MDTTRRVFSCVRMYLGLSSLAATAAVCTQFRAMVDEDVVWLSLVEGVGSASGLRLCERVARGRRALWRVAARQCRCPKAEVQFLRSLCAFPASAAAFGTPLLRPPPRPEAEEDRIGWARGGEGGQNLMTNYSFLSGGGGSPFPNEWMALMQDTQATFGTGQGRRRLANFFADAPHHWTERENWDSGSCVLALSSMKNLVNDCCTREDPAMARILLDCGLAAAMIELLKQQTELDWLSCDQNYFCIYYAVHILGSSIHAALPPSYALEILDRGALGVLLPLLAGSFSWTEGRLAVRCLTHLCQGGPEAVRRIVAAGGVPLIAHFMEHVLPVCVREDVAKPARAPHWHRDVLLGVREGSYRAELWKTLDMADENGTNCLSLLANGRGTAGMLAVTEPGVLRLVTMWLLADPWPGNGGADVVSQETRPRSPLRIGALELLKTLLNSHPLVEKQSQRPLPPLVLHSNYGGENVHSAPTRYDELVIPDRIVPPDDVDAAREVARRVVAAGLHAKLVLLGHAECSGLFSDFIFGILGGIAVEPACHEALVSAGTLPLLLAGAEANIGVAGDGRFLRRCCFEVLELLTARPFADAGAESARVAAREAMARLQAVEYTTKAARVAGYTAGMAAKKAGNAAFKAGDHGEAAACYAESLRLLPWQPCLATHEGYTVADASPAHMAYLKERATVLSNMAEVQLRLGERR